jgi:hypothetical protein
MPDRPQEMYTRDRLPVQEFSADERFYHRIHPDHVQPDGSVLPVHIQCPNLSCNRSRFSQPWHVLFPLEHFGLWAVFQFDFAHVDKTVQGDGQNVTVYDVVMIHCPDPDNYAHCEVRIHRNGVALREHKINSTAKKKFKLSMSKALRLTRPANMMPA